VAAAAAGVGAAAAGEEAVGEEAPAAAEAGAGDRLRVPSAFTGGERAEIFCPRTMSFFHRAAA